jgi:hypothetical protein
MFRLSSIFLLMLFCSAALSQTPAIAYKSHSGAAADYHRALAENLFDIGLSNFGVAPTREVKNAQLDSVIYLNDSAAVMVTSEFCTRVDRGSGKPVSDPRLWKAGRDTVIRHPLFSRRHALDSIRARLGQDYNFQNPVDKVVFLGYDNGEKPGKKKNKRQRQDIFPLAPPNTGSGPFDNTFVGLLAGVVILSLAAALLIHVSYRRKARLSRHAG